MNCLTSTCTPVAMDVVDPSLSPATLRYASSTTATAVEESPVVSTGGWDHSFQEDELPGSNWIVEDNNVSENIDWTDEALVATLSNDYNNKSKRIRQIPNLLFLTTYNSTMIETVNGPMRPGNTMRTAMMPLASSLFSQ
ncbi:hypothetical protein, partial, partial [Parasitella parasitica]